MVMALVSLKTIGKNILTQSLNIVTEQLNIPINNNFKILCRTIYVWIQIRIS